jgi:hypothetical protein
MNKTTTRRGLGALLAAMTTAFALLAGCGGGDDTAAPDSTATGASDVSTTTTEPAQDTEQPAPPCGVTLADIQELLPADSGVAESSTPDPGRCNFTWDDGGPRGIDVAIVAGGAATFEEQAAQVPDGDSLRNGDPYDTVDVDADRAWAFGDASHVSAVAIRDGDLYACDYVSDGAGDGGPTTPAGLDEDHLALCTQLLTRMLA